MEEQFRKNSQASHTICTCWAWLLRKKKRTHMECPDREGLRQTHRLSIWRLGLTHIAIIGSGGPKGTSCAEMTARVHPQVSGKVFWNVLNK
jgi:hypothetical protein